MTDPTMRRRWPVLGGKRRFLISIGAVFVILGYSYLAAPAPTASVAFAVRLMPLATYGWIFITAGTVAVVSALLRPGPTVGFVLLQFVSSAWATCYLMSQLVAHYPRGFVLAALFGALSVAIGSVAGLLEVPPGQK